MKNVQKLVVMAMLIALSVVLVALIHFPLFPAAPFLEYDPADIPVLLATFLFGPLSGVVITVLASVIQGVTVSAASGVYGILMHVIATGTYVLVAGLLYRKKAGLGRLAAAVIAGALAMATVMAAANLLITPFFMTPPGGDVQAMRETTKGMLLPVFLPFNLLKAGINGAITYLLYVPLSTALQRIAPEGLRR